MGTLIPALPASLDEGDEHGSICLLSGTVLCALLHLHRAGDEEGAVMMLMRMANVTRILTSLPVHYLNECTK